MTDTQRNSFTRAEVVGLIETVTHRVIIKIRFAFLVGVGVGAVIQPLFSAAIGAL
jgi:hypothetical protein